MTLLALFLFVPVLIGILFGLQAVLAVRRPYAEKDSVYECGFTAQGTQTRSPYSVGLYLVTILLLIFDLEIALVYPAAVALGDIGTYGFWLVLALFALLTVGFMYEWSKSALSFTDHRSAISAPVDRKI